MASLPLGSLCKPTSSLRSTPVVDRSSLATGAQASKFLRICNLEKNNSLGFQQRRYDNQSFFERFTLQQRRQEKFVSNAASTSNLESDATHDLSSPIESTIKFLVALYRFIRPYAAVGTVLSVLSMALLSVERLSDFSPLFFMRMLQALVGGMFMQMYVCGFNQICDIELDKSLSTAWISGSVPLLWGFIGWFVVGTAYSANVLPLLRWKRFPFSAAFYMLTARALVVPVGYYLHMQNSVHGLSTLLSRPTLFAVGMLSAYSISTIFFKDIPDMEGDKLHGIKSLALTMGQKPIYWSCIWVLEVAYAAAILVGATSSVSWSKYVTIIGHLVMAILLWIRAKSVDLKNMEAIQSMYMFLWQLFYAEYFFLPLVR